MPVRVNKWCETTIAGLGRVVTGKTPPTANLELFGDDYPFITPTDINETHHTVQTERFLSEEGRTTQRNLLLPVDAVCFTCIGATIGKMCLTTAPSFTNQQINSVIVDEINHDARFVFHLLRHEAPRIKGLASGAATPILNKTAFSEVKVKVPPLPVQCKIAAILCAYDDLIENNRRRIRVLEAMAQTLYREWFVHFRFPSHASVPLVDSPLGKIPEGWLVTRLSNIADINASSILRTNQPEDINYIDIASVSTGRIEEIQPIAFADAPSRARRIVKHGDIIWSTVRPNRRSYSLILRPVSNLIVSTGFAVVSAKDVPYSYLYYALTTDDFANYLANRATGAAYPAVTANDFEEAEVLLPTDDVLRSFHRIVGDILDLKQNLIDKNNNLRQTRDLLLPKLISGELDVEHLGIKTSDEA